MEVSFSGLSCDNHETIRRIRETISCSKTRISCLHISDIDVDVELASCIVQLIQKHCGTITHLSLLDCTGHIDIVVTVSLTMNGLLETLEIGTSNLDKCAHSLGVGLLTSTNLKHLVLHSGKKRYFTLVAETAASLAKGLIGSKRLKSFSLKKCRFGDSGAIQSIVNGLKLNEILQTVVLRECLSANGQALPQDRFWSFLDALKGNQSLRSLDLARNWCHSFVVSEIIKSTNLRELNLSRQIISERMEVNLSLMVGAMGGSSSLERLNLACNQLDDGDMPYLAASLSCNTSIQHVDLSGNEITNTGISILASKIPSMKGLQHLVLTNNPFDGNGMGSLRRSLLLNYSIMHLDLDSTLRNYVSCMFYPDLNWMRRRYLLEGEVDPALWPLLLERTNRLSKEPHGSERRANVVFYILQKSSALFPW